MTPSPANSVRPQQAAPANLPPALQQAVLQAQRQNRADAGPQLNVLQPPWTRPGGEAANIASVQWPGRAADWSIPLRAVPANALPNHNTADQKDVNKTLQDVDDYWTANGRLGPHVIRREISSIHPANRRNIFESKAVGNQRFMIDPDTGVLGMSLQEYSLAATEAVREHMQVGRGTVALLASRAQPDQLARLDQQSPYQRFIRSLPEGTARVGKLEEWAASGAGTQASEVWHNTAVLVIRIQKHPSTQSANVVNGVYARVYIYDSSFINENIVSRPVSKAMQDGEPNRLRNYLMMHHTTAFCAELTGEDGRCKWAKDVMFIGGGGNTAGLDECRFMSFVWIQQTAELVAAVNEAIARYVGGGRTTAQLADVERAQRELDSFFADYVPATVQ